VSLPQPLRATACQLRCYTYMVNVLCDGVQLLCEHWLGSLCGTPASASVCAVLPFICLHLTNVCVSLHSPLLTGSHDQAFQNALLYSIFVCCLLSHRLMVASTQRQLALQLQQVPTYWWQALPCLAARQAMQ
jgi:hypothetical protein